MANLRDIKQRIVSVQSTSQITRTMEMVATAKIKKAQEKIEAARPYALAMVEVLGNVARFVQGASHPLLEEHDKRERVAVVSITSDRGLCGAFNSNILRLTEQIISREQSNDAETSVIAVGKKAISYLRYRGVEPTVAYRDISDKPTFADARAIAAHIIPAYEAGEIDAAYVAFNRFKNVAEQKAEVYQLLPIERRVMETEDAQIDQLMPEYVFEPDAGTVLERLLPTYVETLIYRALMESAASEHGARRTAMKSATDNATEMVNTLTRSYNRARQAAITNEIAEIVGGAAALEDS
ncbi:MAG: ATP synthase F1 subunit gamma [Coriobacteriia bacterium]|nr:ATP synthase F1 subunit gamma [Coriobacteriia bacterium]